MTFTEWGPRILKYFMMQRIVLHNKKLSDTPKNLSNDIIDIYVIRTKQNHLKKV